MLFIQFQNICHTPYGRMFFFSFSRLFHRCNYNSFHLPQREHLEYCKERVKLETLQGTFLLSHSCPAPLRSSAPGRGQLLCRALGLRVPPGAVKGG